MTLAPNAFFLYQQVLFKNFRFHLPSPYTMFTLFDHIHGWIVVAFQARELLLAVCLSSRIVLWTDTWKLVDADAPPCVRSASYPLRFSIVVAFVRAGPWRGSLVPIPARESEYYAVFALFSPVSVVVCCLNRVWNSQQKKLDRSNLFGLVDFFFYFIFFAAMHNVGYVNIIVSRMR